MLWIVFMSDWMRAFLGYLACEWALLYLQYSFDTSMQNASDVEVSFALHNQDSVLDVKLDGYLDALRRGSEDIL